MAKNAESTIRAAESGVPEERWQRVHILTPFIQSWHLIVVIPALIAWQNPEIFTEFSVEDVRNVFDGTSYLSYILLAVAAVILVIVAISYLMWRRTNYALGDEAVWFRSGILMRSQRHARFDRVQSVDIVQPLLGRIFGLGKLRIEVAGGADSHFDIAFLSMSDLEVLRNQVVALAAGTRRTTQADNPTVNQAAPDSTGTPHYLPSEATTEHTSDDLHSGLTISSANGQTVQNGGAAQNQAPAHSAIPMEERALFSVPAKMHIQSLLLSLSFLISALVLIATIVTAVLLARWGGAEVLLAGAAGLVPLIIVPAQVIWTEFNTNFNFSAFASAEGIRIQRGLTEARSQTIPPKRVHAVEVTQPWLWRKMGWYRVRIVQAGNAVLEANRGQSDILLPVGTRLQAELAMWLVVPELGVHDPLSFIENALNGANDQADPRFIATPKSVRKLDWLTWKRRACAVTPAVFVIRQGRITRRTAFIPVERIQSVKVSQGPYERTLGVADICAQVVPGSIPTIAAHIPAQHVMTLTAELVRLSAERRYQDVGLTWEERVQHSATPFAVEDTR